MASIKPTERPTRIEEMLALAESLANPVRSTEDTASQPGDVADDREAHLRADAASRRWCICFPMGDSPSCPRRRWQGLSLRMADDPATGGLNIRYHMAGKLDENSIGDTNNLAIVGFNVLRQNLPGKKNAPPTQRHLAFVRVANFRKQPADRAAQARCFH